MSTRNMMWLGAMAAMLGCTGQASGPSGAPAANTDPTLFLAIGGCSYPQYGCSTGNGTGVYYQEGGFAGLDSYKLMITHFINSGSGSSSSVFFQGRYSNPQGTFWQMLPRPGIVYEANYNGVAYRVLSVSESGTNPTWTLNNNSPTNVTVSGAQLANLILFASFADPITGADITYELWFGNMTTETGSSPSPWNQTSLTKYTMWYYNLNTNGGWKQYCTDANNNADPVVFQGNIDVAPTSGSVTTSSTDVTLSCRLGAIATVYYWGYDYKADLWHYAAGIHMKRASYCGDASYYTGAGTRMMITDDAAIQQQRPYYGVEAFWTPNGASCFNQSRRPDWELKQYFNVTGFDITTPTHQALTCNGSVLPTCPSYASMFDVDGNPIQGFLVDGIVPGQ